MSDDLKNGATIILGLALFAGFLNHRAERAIVHDLSRSAKGGELHANVRPRGLFGLLVGQGDTARVWGKGFTTEDLPFKVTSGSGLRARVRTLKFDFEDFTLRGAQVKRFSAVIPSVNLDIFRAFFDDRIVVRTAGEGTAEAVVDEKSLADFVTRKYPQLTDVEVKLLDGRILVGGNVNLLGAKTRLDAVSNLAIKDGRYVNAVDMTVALNNKEAAPFLRDTIINNLNPVLDFEKDLGLGGYFYATSLEMGKGLLTVRGRAMVPRADELKGKVTPDGGRRTSADAALRAP
jgi:hypothetical protein